MKLDRQRIDNDQSLDSWAEMSAPGAGDSIVEIEGYDQCYASSFSDLEGKIKTQHLEIDMFLKEIDAGIQPARRALENCDGEAVFSDLRNVRARLAAKQCNSSPGISARLREIDILGNALSAGNCTKLRESACNVLPITAPVLPGEYYTLSSFYGSDGAAHCLTAAEAKAVNDKSDKTARLIGDGETCSRCSEGYSLKSDKNGDICVKCPEGQRYDSGCY